MVSGQNITRTKCHKSPLIICFIINCSLVISANIYATRTNGDHNYINRCSSLPLVRRVIVITDNIRHKFLSVFVGPFVGFCPHLSVIKLLRASWTAYSSCLSHALAFCSRFPQHRRFLWHIYCELHCNFCDLWALHTVVGLSIAPINRSKPPFSVASFTP